MKETSLSTALAATFAAGIATGVVGRCLWTTSAIRNASTRAQATPTRKAHFGNPSSSHVFGTRPKQAIDAARKSLLKMIGAPVSTPTSAIWFTGCGTESDNLAIQLALQSSYPNSTQQKRHIVTSNVEHPAIDVCLQRLEEDGLVDVTYVPVDNQGRVSAENVIAAIRPNHQTVLVTLMLANNESGAIQPVAEVARHCRQMGILCHTDAAQAVGKMDVSLQSLGHVDMMTIVGHKIGCPKGVSALYVRPDCFAEHGRQLRDGSVMLMGGGQEGGRRGGTENVPYIVGMGKAADLVSQQWQENAAHMEAMRARLLRKLVDELGETMVKPNGPIDPTMRLPNTLSVGLRNVQSGDLLARIGNQVAASAGAACHSSGASAISAVLVAMNVPVEYAKGTLRLSVGPTTSAEDVDRAAAIIAEEARRQLA